MHITEVLGRLDKVKKNNEHQWSARCPAHDDEQNSLSISVNGDDKIAMHCHAGCEIGDVLGASGLKLADLFPPKPEKSNSAPKVYTNYDYRDVEGNLLYQNVRIEQKGERKKFTHRRSDGNGGWVWNLDGVEKTLFNLQGLLDAATNGQTVFYAEGEKDCVNLMGLGYVATTAGGAESWKSEFVDYFAGVSKIIIIPDKDTSGEKCANHVAYDLKSNGFKVKILNLPVKSKGDFTDWAESSGATIHNNKILPDPLKPEIIPRIQKEFVQLVNSCAWYQLPEICPEEEAKPLVKANAKYALNDLLTDKGMSNLLVELYGENIRYDVNTKEYLKYTGKRWEYDDLFDIYHLVDETINTLYDRMKNAEDSDRTAIYKHIKKSQSKSGIVAMVDLVKTRPGIAVRASMLDTDTMLLNCRNGTIDLRNGKLLPHNKEQLLCKMVDVDYLPDADCPTFQKFLNDIFDGDKELIHYVQKVFGYSICGATRDQKFFIHYGTGSNGKSTLMTVVNNILGDYYKAAAPETFINMGNNSSRSYDIASMPGVRMVGAIETKEGGKLEEAMVKQVTGEDVISARKIYGSPFNFKPHFKLHLAVNHLPNVTGTEIGMWRRIVAIPFLRKFDGNNPKNPDYKDTMLPDKLQLEHTGILAWMVQGCLMWQSENLGSCRAVDNATNKYRSSQDLLADFLSDKCTIGKDKIVQSSTLYKTFHDWCIAGGISKPITQKTFKQKLEDEKEFVLVKGRNNNNWEGVGLIGSDTEIGFDDENDESVEANIDFHEGCGGLEGNSQTILSDFSHVESCENSFQSSTHEETASTDEEEWIEE
jgi:putative DNA primase/helicase